MREQEIRLVHEAGIWVAVDVGTGVTAHGETREEALTSLDAELAASDETGGDSGDIRDADDLRREVGVEPDALDDEEI